MRVKGKHILVYGMGVSGQAVCKLLHSHGAVVSIYDDEKRYVHYFNFEKEPTSKKYDLVVVSPGVKVLGNAIISFFVAKGTLVVSELDIGYLFFKGQIIGITGTNGKTTVTTLTGNIFKKAGKETFVCGNIGLPLSSVALHSTKNSIAVCEVSNFQLELSKYFKAELACLLNLAPDHLDRHGGYEEYKRIKLKIFSKKRKQKIVLNFDDEFVRTVSQDKKTLFFSKKILKKGVFVKNNAIFCNKTKIISLNDIPLFGEKNLENVLASVAIASKYKLKPSIIKEGIVSYIAPHHRLEYLGQTNGADVFDDSKATNVSATISAINSLGDNNLVLMLGGLNKGSQFDEIFNKGFNFEEIICFGQAGEEIAKCAEKYSYPCKVFETMKTATQFVKDHASKGQKILISPSCASFDEFASYSVRGEIFKEIIFGVYEKIEMSQ